MDFHDSLVTEALFSEVARKDWQDFIKKYRDERPGTYYCQFTNFASSVDDKRFAGSLTHSHADKAPLTPGAYGVNKSGDSFKVGPDWPTKHNDKQAERRATSDKTLWAEVSHHDPIGIYTYPAELVIEKSGQMPYGKDMKYMRVLKAKPGIKRLELQDMTDKEANIRLLEKAGVFDLLRLSDDGKLTPSIIWDHAEWQVEQEYMDGRTNTIPKTFFYLLQRQYSPKGGGISFIRLNNKAQSRRIQQLGYDMVEDTAKTKEDAVIYPNEPTQAVFLNRGAFDIVDVYQANTEKTNKRGGKELRGAFTINGVEVKVAHAVADLLNDQVRTRIANVYGGTEHGTTDSDEVRFDHKTIFTTKKGRQMGANAQYATDEVAEGHIPIAVVFELKGEKGVVHGTLTPRESIKDFAEKLVAQFRSQPDDPRWTPKRGGLNEGEQMWKSLISYVVDRLLPHSRTHAEYKPGHTITSSVNIKKLGEEAAQFCDRLSQRMSDAGWKWVPPTKWYEQVAAWILAEAVHNNINRIYGEEVTRYKVEKLINDHKNFSSHEWNRGKIDRARDEIKDPEKLAAFEAIHAAWSGNPLPGMKPLWWDGLLNGLAYLYTEQHANYVSPDRYPNFGSDQRDKMHHLLTKPLRVKPAASSS